MTAKAHRNFWVCFDHLPADIRRIARKRFGSGNKIPSIHRYNSSRFASRFGRRASPRNTALSLIDTVNYAFGSGSGHTRIMTG